MLQFHSGILGRWNTAHKWHHLFSDNDADLFISTTECAMVLYRFENLLRKCLFVCFFFSRYF